ncbi:MAG: hypothetical protein LBJ96_05635, partial [Holosporaceae bacterium]|nr:hypothetical protein [Holosporaceae bacterium]
GATPEEKIAATGMLVYNTAGVLHGKGLYIWNGTKWQPLKSAPTIKDIEGNEYFIGDFGDAGWWTTQNLRSTTGLEANSNSGNAYDQKYYWYPDNNKSTFESNPTYGLLYTWAAATGRTDISDNEANTDHTDHQGICPDGWHLPSDYEWSELEKEIATNPGNYSNQTTPYANAGSFSYGTTTTYRPFDTFSDNTYWGRQMKSKTAVNGQTSGSSNGRGANGFDALLVGYMGSGSPIYYGTQTYFWSSSYHSSITAWCRYLADNYTKMSRFTYYKYYMFSVRCKKNDN